MRIIIEYSPPKLRMFIHNAPHRRMHHVVLAAYREELWSAWLASGHKDTITTHVDLHVTFINPSSTDLDNLITALFQALDGNTGKKPTILKDDGLISFVAADLLRS
jgi:Holliday junction resolvase RusA-like endonuclease